MNWFWISVLCLGFGSDRIASTAPLTAELPRQVSVRLTTRVELPRVGPEARRVQLWIPIPRDDEHQVVREISAPGSPQLTREPTLGNRFLYYEISSPESAPLDVVIQCDVVRTAYEVRPGGQSVRTPSPATLANWLRADRLIPIDGEAKTISDSIVRGAITDREKAERIYHYVFDHMTYDKSVPGWGNADFARACQIGKGNCTDFHCMFLALCRAQKIPAHIEIGVELATDGSTAVLGSYHCWAAYYLPSHGWAPADISSAWKRAQAARSSSRPELADIERRNGFGRLDGFRVAISRGLDVQTAPPCSAPLRFLIDPVMDVDGKRVPVGDPKTGGVRRTWSYVFSE
jgi:transglutaminase-like putative cysteine protease